MKFFRTILTLALLANSLFVYAGVYAVPTPPNANKKISLYVIDFNSNRVLASQNEHKKREIASLTKLMTAYVAFKRLGFAVIDLADEVKISDKAYKTLGSRSFIEKGEYIKFEILLKGMIIQSGNDASVAIAQHIAGDEETFVQYMNLYAKELGMKNTLFANASGLSSGKHYSTAYDLSILAKALISEFPQYYHWFGQKEFTHNNITQKNRNSMLWSDASVDGLKTGFTDAAGYCLIVSAKRENMRVVSVVLGAKSKNKNNKLSKKLLDYSFRFYETQPLMGAEKSIIQANVKQSSKYKISVGSLSPVYLTLPRGQFKTVKQTIQLPQDLNAPINIGDKLGRLMIKIDEEVVAQYPLYALEAAEKSGFFGKIINGITSFF